VPWDAIASSAAVLAAASAAWQLWRLRVDALDVRASEIASVSLATVVLERPVSSAAQDVWADWVFEYTIHNPGRLPIHQVQAVISFPCDVQRRRYDGTLDAATRSLELRAATIPPHSSHPGRRRKLSVAASELDLEKVRVRLAFNVSDAGNCVTVWPPEKRKAVRALRVRLGRR